MIPPIIFMFIEQPSELEAAIAAILPLLAVVQVAKTAALAGARLTTDRDDDDLAASGLQFCVRADREARRALSLAERI